MERMNMEAMNMMDRMMGMGMTTPIRRMENELGKLISSVKDDENSFQVDRLFHSFQVVPDGNFFFFCGC